MLFRLLLLAGVVCSSQAFALNKCTLPDGRVSFQDTPCAPNAEVEVLRKPKPMPKPAAPAAPAVQPDFSIRAPEQAAALMVFYRRWFDGEKLMASTARVALAAPMSMAQQLQREVEAYVAPECLAPAATALRELIAANNEAMLMFMQKQEVTHMRYELLTRPEKIKEFEQSIQNAMCD